MLQCEHRQIEQALAILESHGESSVGEFSALVAILVAHLAAEEMVFYPAAEDALGEPLRAQREQHLRVRAAIAEAVQPKAGAFTRRLLELTEAFKQHSRIEERSLHPSLDGRLGDGPLEALGARIALFRSSVRSAPPAAKPRRKARSPRR
jgi:hypothetical protein